MEPGLLRTGRSGSNGESPINNPLGVLRKAICYELGCVCVQCTRRPRRESMVERGEARSKREIKCSNEDGVWSSEVLVDKTDHLDVLMRQRKTIWIRTRNRSGQRQPAVAQDFCLLAEERSFCSSFVAPPPLPLYSTLTMLIIFIILEMAAKRPIATTTPVQMRLLTTSCLFFDNLFCN